MTFSQPDILSEHAIPRFLSELHLKKLLFFLVPHSIPS